MKENGWFIILLFPYVFYIYKTHKKILCIIVITLLLYQFRVSLFDFTILKQEEIYEVTVKSEIKHTYKTSFIGVIDNINVLINLPDVVSLKPGDTYLVKGDLSIPRNNTIPNGFNYLDYLHQKGINQILTVSEYEYKSHTFHIYQVREYIQNYIEKNTPKTKEYISTFILADTEGFDPEFKESIRFLGVSHLFAVSGLHIGLLVVVCEKLIQNKYKNIIISSILIFYMVITLFSPSVVRASLLYITIKLKTYKKLPLSNIDILSIIFIGYLYVSPYQYHHIGFQLSFIVTFCILLSQYLIQKKSLITQLYTITLISFLSTLPLILSINYEINIYSIFMNTIMILYMSYIILPFGYLTFLIPILDGLYDIIIKPFSFLITTHSKITLFTLQFTFTHPILVILYYVLLCMILMKQNKKKYIEYLMIVLVISYFSNHLSPIKEISVIDIYGDSILIVDQFDRCNIVVDTGVDDQYDTVVNYIKSKNIKTIDYLIITHYHDDHMGEMDDILDQFNVEQIIDYNTDVNFLSCGSFDLTFFKEVKQYDENNKSVVFQLKINKDTYLFTGDIEYDRETELIQEYILSSDYLKAGHHGSITSSSEPFIDHVSPHTALITSYYKNTHNHPSIDVIQRFDVRNIEIYRIDEDGTIVIQYVFGLTLKKTTPP